MNNINEPDYKRITLAVFLAAITLIAWQLLVEWPRRQQMSKVVQTQVQKTIEDKKNNIVQIENKVATKEAEAEYNPKLSRTQRLALSPRIAIKSDKIHGSIALKGARFDDLTLAKYKETLEKDSADVTLLTPNGDENAYFAQAGWVASDGKTIVPDGKSLWKADKQSLAAGEAVNLKWDNGAGVVFVLNIALDADYMFSFNQRVENHSGQEIKVAPYGYINRSHQANKQLQNDMILHEGPIGVMEGAVSEIAYKDLREKGAKIIENANGWLGITDKYWITTLIPDGNFKANFSHYNKNTQDRYQVDYLGAEQTIENNMVQESKLRLFAGAKEIEVLDKYTNGDVANKIPPITLFDRAVDFGSLYFLTKPLFLMLNFFYKLIGNFGLAIMMVTIVVKACMYPLANKSYKAMAQMKDLQPEIALLKEKHKDDSAAVSKETMALYKRNKVNPAAGCLPILLQMPVFFALYKVLYVTLEMRHAPFFGWLKDLSASDPSNIFTAFGLINWNPSDSFHIGILPILYCVTMLIQQSQQPKPADPVQAKMMRFMPFLFMYVFSGLPAGLVLYWVWSNILSIVQQEIITLRHGSHRSQIAKKATTKEVVKS